MEVMWQLGLGHMQTLLGDCRWEYLEPGLFHKSMVASLVEGKWRRLGVRGESRVVDGGRQQQREACRRWAYAVASAVADSAAPTSRGLQLGSQADNLYKNNVTLFSKRSLPL